MAHHQKSRPRRTQCSGELPDDLYDYLRPTIRRRGRPAKNDRSEWTVTGDWPDEVPITEAEIELFEALVRRPVRRIVFNPPLTPLVWRSP
jgi:hypothetical protein